MSEAELRAFCRPDESAFDLLARTATEPIPTGVFFLGSLRAGQILEVTGSSGTAKSELLIQVQAIPQDFPCWTRWISMIARRYADQQAVLSY